MNTQNTILDTDELIHLALHATNNRQPEKAIAYLKKIIEIDPQHGKAWYLLGALHAEIGMYPRAIEEMTKAVQLEPELHTAHFQLGLLYISSGMLDDARKAWEPLDALGENNALFLFKRGMLSMATDEFEACIADLRKGISLNNSNLDLNRDMLKMIDAAEQAISGKAQAGAKQPETQNTDQEKSGKKGKGGKHVLLSAYQQQSYDDEQ